MNKIPNGTAIAFLNNAFTYDGEECLIWPYALSNGYASIEFPGYTTKKASRIICEHIHGPAPAQRMDAAHSCGNRACINWRHLRWATRKENEADKVGHGRTRRGKPSKLSPSDVLAIRQSAESSRHLAPRFGVAASAIRAIRQRRNWRWL